MLSGAQVTAGEGLGCAGAGEGVPSADSPSGNWGDGSSEPRGGSGRCGPTSPNLEPSSRCAFLCFPPGRSDSVWPAQSLSLSALGPPPFLCQSVRQSGCPGPSASVCPFVFVWDLSLFVCPTVFVPSLSVIVCLYSSLSVCSRVQSVCLSASLSLPHSVWLRLTPGHFSK